MQENIAKGCILYVNCLNKVAFKQLCLKTTLLGSVTMALFTKWSWLIIIVSMKEPCSTEFISAHTVREEIAKSFHHPLLWDTHELICPSVLLTGKLQHMEIQTCIWIGWSREGKKKMENSDAKEG